MQMLNNSKIFFVIFATNIDLIMDKNSLLNFSSLLVAMEMDPFPMYFKKPLSYWTVLKFQLFNQFKDKN